MAFDKIVAADSATYQLPPLVRQTIANNISGGEEDEYDAVVSVVNEVLAEADLGSLPKWTTETRPSSPGDSALIGFNTETEEVEFYNTVSDEWEPIGAGSKFTVGTTAPTEAENGDTWFNSETGSTYIYYVDTNSSQWVEIGGSGGQGDIVIADLAPTSPQPGDLWYDSVTGSTFIYYEDTDSTQWVEIGQTSQPTAAYVRASTPPSAEQGQLWLDTRDGVLYVYYDDGTSGQWIGVKAATAVSPSLESLSDTVITSATAGDLLQYDGTDWANVDVDTALGAGKILQVVSAIRTASTSTASTSFVDVGDVTVSITPSSTSNKVFILVTGVVGNNDASHVTPINIVRDSTAICQSTGGAQFNQSHATYSNSTQIGTGFAIHFLDSPNTTSATTYKLQFRASGGTGYIGRWGANNNAPTPTVITVMEVAA